MFYIIGPPTDLCEATSSVRPPPVSTINDLSSRELLPILIRYSGNLLWRAWYICSQVAVLKAFSWGTLCLLFSRPLSYVSYPMGLDRLRHAELSSIGSCFAWWHLGANFWRPCTYFLSLVLLGVFFSALSEFSFLILYSISSALRFLCPIRMQAFDSCTVFSGAWMHRMHGLFHLCNAASCRPSSWSCPVLVFSRCILQRRN